MLDVIFTVIVRSINNKNGNFLLIAFVSEKKAGSQRKHLQRGGRSMEDGPILDAGLLNFFFFYS